ncbi:calcineurin-like phosphoesterase [Ordospora pajunii]|uniref:calcineurin-like phosphoesterase n=1 Tax=Ordospora pajunii TaxID=3039483 RepID=UPI00295279D9|nr:calcineurin-like phosphoesterase [Ordospora pajunii]KAH9410834.1 calcineurin-like phosphoesterase [Ordospora pajunii]
MNGFAHKLLNLEILPEHDVMLICTKVSEILISEPNVPSVHSPVTICGDIHGQFFDLVSMLCIDGMPSQRKYVFLGDYVDRGKNSLECILFLFVLKIIYPDSILLIRGNHEQAVINRVYGFYDEVIEKYGSSRVWRIINEVFCLMNVGCLVDGRVLCVHGGISPKITSINQMKRIDRMAPISDSSEFSDIMWGDPYDGRGFQPSPRGSGYLYGSDVVCRFLELNNLVSIVRSHQLVIEGYKFHFDERNVITVWSAPNYLGKCGNPASILRIDEDLDISDKDFCVFKATPQKREFLRMPDRFGI